VSPSARAIEEKSEPNFAIAICDVKPMTAGPERHSADRKPGKSIMNMYAMLELAGAFSLIWHNLADSLIAVSHHSIALLSVRLAS